MYDGAVLSLRQRTTYAMLLLSLYVVPLPPGHVGADATSADATSAVARIAVALTAASTGLPEAEVTADLTSRVSLVLSGVTVAESVALVMGLETRSVDELDVDSNGIPFDIVTAEPLPSGQITSGSHAFFEQHPQKPFVLQA